MREVVQSVIAILFLVALGAQQAHAQTDITVPAGDVNLLIQAINDTNADATGPRTIRLTRSTYTLTAVDNDTGGNGANGLPRLTQTMTIEGNGATLERTGGALFRFLLVSGGTSTLRDLTLRGGQSGSSGGALYVVGAAVVIERCAFAGNTAAAGGALGLFQSSGMVESCTFEGNSAETSGGAIDSGNSTLTANDCTIVRNSCGPGSTFGGGTFGPVTLTNTIVALNTASIGPDVETATLTNCFIGDTSGATITDVSGNVLDGGDPLVGPLQDNGGLTPTCALLSGSQAIDIGTSTGPTTDQRGTGFPRTNGALPDMGAYEHSPAPIVARVTAPVVTTTGATTHQFTVRYVSDLSGGGINVSTLGNSNLVVTGPGGFSEAASLVPVALTDGTPREATYEINAPLGGWQAQDRGAYTISLLTDEVLDTVGVAVADGAIGTFLVLPPFAVATAPDVTTPGGTAHTITVTYTDELAINVATLGAGDVVVNPGALPAAFVSVDLNTDGTPRVATYTITPPGGSWNEADSATYSIALQAGQVTDTSANAVPAGDAGTFTVTVDETGPTAAATAPDVTTSGGTTYTFTVTYTDATAVDVSTLDDDDLIVNPGALPATFVSVDVNTNGAAREATYTITAPGGTWDAVDNGTYTIALQAGEVSGTSAEDADAGTVGTFTVAVTDPPGHRSGGGCSMDGRTTASGGWSPFALGFLGLLAVRTRRRSR